MDYGSIIKRSWRITWRYKALWVLGIFAGVSGCTGGGSSGGGNSGYRESSGADFNDLNRAWSDVQEFLPLIIGTLVLLFFVGVLWSVFSIAARGGLVTGVNAAEQGAPQPLGELWRAGFARFWSLVGLDIMLALPLMVVGLAMVVLIVVPIIGAAAAGGEPGPEMLGPVCGSLLIGLPLLLVGGFILGIMRLLAQRYVMLGGQGAIEATRNSWRFFRARLKDTAIMWLINAGLNIAASIVLAIPAVVLGIAVAVPFVAAIATQEWGALAATIPVAIVLFGLLGLAYNAVWGTYTSALWTLFFRDVSGMTVASAPAPAAPVMPSEPASPYAPAPQPPVAPPPAPASSVGGPVEPAWTPAPPSPPIAPFAPDAQPAPAPESPVEQPPAPEPPAPADG